ncbi:lysophospholipase [Plasmodium yoelii yoelii]|uniref:Lysophospholipase n=1 Tax=Plasmodium yoelii yoelii TaxID=73239 RepID=A0AAF0B5T3_PLAYO|nr:lysophospholipase [Plasmodium yoelii yoelii]
MCINTKCNLDGDPKTGRFCNKNGLLLKTYGWLVKNDEKEDETEDEIYYELDDELDDEIEDEI